MSKFLMVMALFFAALSPNAIGMTPAGISGGGSAVQNVNPVIEWNRTLLVIVRTPGAQPATIHPTRSFAIMHAAVYDAVNAIAKTHKVFLVHVPGAPREASKNAAAAAAAHKVLVALYPSFQAQLDAQFQQDLAQIHDAEDVQEGVSIGETVATQILAIRANDGSSVKPGPFVFGTAPGDYQSTPPNFPQPQFTEWSHVTPFALRSARQFRPGPPPALNSDTYGDAFLEVKSVGVENSTTATADQALTGRFWNGAIQNYWNEITQTAALGHQLSTAESARLFALLNISLADGVIAFYDAKYTYTFWRPVTAIRAADPNVNRDTTPDPNWLPEVVKTGNDPSYPGAHGVLSAVGGFVLDSFFERDRFSFTVTSEVLPGVTRSFNKFSSAVKEATLSRIFAGQHFRFDQETGNQLGRNVADFVVDHFLTEREHEDGDDRD
ncbi:MAG TPA: vanadium-dependent haloperoxidase [Candidatus Angelobacter sp.]|nr:vanadium-dependent haloperoxidase [Candidatus Angelobacter sp.]